VKRKLPKPTAKQAASPAATVNLPTLAGEGPKLHHMCSERPRRVKKKAVTRPTVGLTHIDEDDNDVDMAFTSPAPKSPAVGGTVVNGELERGWEKANGFQIVDFTRLWSFCFFYKVKFYTRLLTSFSFCNSLLFFYHV